ncbi:MAG: hypothetical protein LBV40_07250, partial [Methanomicrobiales archaeon]|nr:hypothetical protein [Methanomicrobiales archaeon]
PEIANDDGVCYLPEDDLDDGLQDEDDDEDNSGECVLPEIANEDGLCYLPKDGLEGDLEDDLNASNQDDEGQTGSLPAEEV